MCDRNTTLIGPTTAICDLTSAMWDLTAATRDVTTAMRDLTTAMLDLTAAMWDLTAAMRKLTTAMNDLTTGKHAVSSVIRDLSAERRGADASSGSPHVALCDIALEQGDVHTARSGICAVWCDLRAARRIVRAESHELRGVGHDASDRRCLLNGVPSDVDRRRRDVTTRADEPEAAEGDVKSGEYDLASDDSAVRAHFCVLELAMCDVTDACRNADEGKRDRARPAR